jgi:large subunit ribosomal protein L14e
MSLLEIGRVCVKKPGREAGKRCVVIDIIDKNFVVVTGPKDVTGVRRRKANIDHLEPTELKMKVSRGASDEEVKEALKKLGETQAPSPVTPPSEAKTEKKVVKPKAEAKTKKTKAGKTVKKKTKEEAASK